MQGGGVMQRHSTKTMQKLGIFDYLKSKVFIKGNKKLVFDFWDYEKGIYQFAFKDIKDLNKSIYDNYKVNYIQLYWQFKNDYKNTIELIESGFDKVEDLKA